jgi:heme oxygenase
VQSQLARKKNAATTHDESESNLSVGSDYEKKDKTNEVSKQIAALTRPVENILLFFAVCCQLPELDESDRLTALKWIGRWDDKSRQYQQIRDRGREIANM